MDEPDYLDQSPKSAPTSGTHSQLHDPWDEYSEPGSELSPDTDNEEQRNTPALSLTGGKSSGKSLAIEFAKTWKTMEQFMEYLDQTLLNLDTRLCTLEQQMKKLCLAQVPAKVSAKVSAKDNPIEPLLARTVPPDSKARAGQENLSLEMRYSLLPSSETQSENPNVQQMKSSVSREVLQISPRPLTPIPPPVSPHASLVSLQRLQRRNLTIKSFSSPTLITSQLFPRVLERESDPESDP